MQCRIGSCEEGRARAQNGHLAIVMASYLQAREPGFFLTLYYYSVQSKVLVPWENTAKNERRPKEPEPGRPPRTVRRRRRLPCVARTRGRTLSIKVE